MRQAEQVKINKLRDSVNDYRLAVMKARHEESNWFSDSLKGGVFMRNMGKLLSLIIKLNEAQEKYIDKSSGLKKALVPIVAGAAIGAVVAGVHRWNRSSCVRVLLVWQLAGALSISAVTATVAPAAGSSSWSCWC